MRTNIEIDDALMTQAMAAYGIGTKREMIDLALRDAVRLAKQRRALRELRGIGWEGDLDDMRTDRPLPAAE